MLPVLLTFAAVLGLCTASYVVGWVLGWAAAKDPDYFGPEEHA